MPTLITGGLLLSGHQAVSEEPCRIEESSMTFAFRNKGGARKERGARGQVRKRVLASARNAVQFESFIVPADGHQSCQLEEAETSVGLRFMGSSQTHSICTHVRGGARRKAQ